ncbi:fumarate hydratase C-terminal domain-containing protein [Pelagibius sp.]|uniref:fumarate hydratase C-terminal domain-containing protein n=1 Tax=Pelagibius sp. TaxID=1931238 RepID=UPI00261E52BC|nr:fumarate hydratase C-terminal domain-containing protein [Pelagibius sp.]
MAKPGSKLKQVRLSLPAKPEDIAALELGSVVYLSGLVYTAREGVYNRVLVEGGALPDGLTEASNVNFHCSPAAAPQPDGSYVIGGVTATASFRFSKYLGDWLDLTGTKIVIGKGGMPRDDYKQVLAPRGAVYLTTVGYGTGALLGRGVKAVRSVHWLEELGIAQALWLFEVEGFGPFIVDSDLTGNSLFAQQGDIVNKGIGRLYKGLKPPALHRYGETDDREDEVM